MLNLFKGKDKQNDPKSEPPSGTPDFKMSIDSLKQTLFKTGQSLFSNISNVMTGKNGLDEDILNDIEDILIRADVGVNTAVDIVDDLRSNKANHSLETAKQALADAFHKLLKQTPLSSSLDVQPNTLNIFLVVGVNGTGKTTLIGKLAYRYRSIGKKVLIAAGDTFRAAAEDQLQVWAERADSDIYRKDQAQPAAVIYEAITKAKNEHYDLLIIDTAGRLQNKFNLMEELKKIKKVVETEGAPYLRETMLVLDATTGQNALTQAKIFKECINITSIALNKIDGTAKGGIIIAIAKELQLPVKLVGVGEQIGDLKDFDSDIYIHALLSE